MSFANCCQVCDSDPRWAITRRGDAVVSWACDDDLSTVLDSMQRDFEVTELVVRIYAKSIEWAQLGDRLNEIADGSQ